MGLFNFLEKKREKKIRDAFNKYDEKQKIAIVLSSFDSEIMNGGLCQFFINDSRLYAPYVADSLSAVGAKDICDKFLKFVEDNKIDLKDLSSFKSRTLEEFSAQYKRYPFDEFDNYYYAQPEESTVCKLAEKYLLNK